MEELLVRGCPFIIPGCGKTSTLSRGENIAARWLNEPQPISNHGMCAEIDNFVLGRRPAASQICIKNALNTAFCTLRLSTKRQGAICVGTVRVVVKLIFLSSRERK